jgi:hypothetical protein
MTCPLIDWKAFNYKDQNRGASYSKLLQIPGEATTNQNGSSSVKIRTQMILKNYRSSSESSWTGTNSVLLTRLFVFGAQPQIKSRRQHQSLVGICEKVASRILCINWQGNDGRCCYHTYVGCYRWLELGKCPYHEIKLCRADERLLARESCRYCD